VGFRLTARPGLAQRPGSQPGREAPDDHCRLIHRARHDPARLHRRRANRPRPVARTDPRDLRAGPGVGPGPWPCSPSAAPTSRALVLSLISHERNQGFAREPEAGRPCLGNRHPGARPSLPVPQVRGRKRVPGPLTCHPRAPTRVDYESHAVALGPQRARRASRHRRTGPPSGHALISLFALNGLRVFEATTTWTASPE
jgi:hypothetical protein